MAASKRSAKKKSKKKKVTKAGLGLLRGKVDAKTFEFIETTIREAQYEGSIVTIITIVPQPKAGKRVAAIKGCKPKAANCKKCYA